MPLAWAMLAAWGASPFAPLLSHRELAEAGLTVVRLTAFTAGWLLMTVAMMLPGGLPLVNLLAPWPPGAPTAPSCRFTSSSATWRSGRCLVSRRLWAMPARHAAVERNPILVGLAQWIGVLVMLTAGVYEVTPFKDVCLEKCRSPYSFGVEHWRRRRPRWNALRLGVRHGLFCVGCCWTLMLVLFAIGGVNVH